MNIHTVKRNAYTVELSKEHDAGLLFCWKIKEGLKRNVAIHRINRYVNYFWKNHLKTHFIEEESLLFNRVDDVQCQQGKTEHLMLIERLNRLNYYESNNKEEYLTFAELLTKHIRFEERVLYPHLETVLPERVLRSIEEFLSRQRVASFEDNYPDEFWLSKV